MATSGFAYIWEYRVRPDAREQFRQHYRPDGRWVQLFRQADGYLGTVLYSDLEDDQRFVTLDRWRSEASFRAFRLRFAASFKKLERIGETPNSQRAMFGAPRGRHARVRSMRHRGTLSLIALSILVSLPATHGTSSAQEPAHTFDTVTVQLRAVANVNRNTFHRFWEPGPGLELNLQAPLNVGTLEAGLHYAGFAGKATEQPDFKVLFPYLGWGYDAPLSSRFSWYNGTRAGSLIMRFDVSQGNRTEQELGLGLVSLLSYRLGGAWSLDLSARYRVVFTHERLRFFFLAAGLGRDFAAPAWLKDLFE